MIDDDRPRPTLPRELPAPTIEVRLPQAPHDALDLAARLRAALRPVRRGRPSWAMRWGR